MADGSARLSLIESIRRDVGPPEDVGQRASGQLSHVAAGKHPLARTCPWETGSGECRPWSGRHVRDVVARRGGRPSGAKEDNQRDR